MSNSFDYNLEEKHDKMKNVIAASLNSMRLIHASVLSMTGRTIIRITSPFPILDEEKEALTDAVTTTIKLMETVGITDDDPEKLKAILESMEKGRRHEV